MCDDLGLPATEVCHRNSNAVGYLYVVTPMLAIEMCVVSRSPRESNLGMSSTIVMKGDARSCYVIWRATRRRTLGRFIKAKTRQRKDDEKRSYRARRQARRKVCYSSPDRKNASLIVQKYSGKSDKLMGIAVVESGCSEFGIQNRNWTLISKRKDYHWERTNGSRPRRRMCKEICKTAKLKQACVPRNLGGVMKDAVGEKEKQGNTVLGVKHDRKERGNSYGDNPREKQAVAVSGSVSSVSDEAAITGQEKRLVMPLIKAGITSETGVLYAGIVLKQSTRGSNLA